MKTKLTLAIFLSLLTTQVPAYDKYGTWTKVDQMYVPADGSSIFVYFEGAESLPGCYAGRAAYLPAANTEGANRLHSVLLAAKASGISVRAYYNYTGADANSWSRCTLEAVYIK